MDRSQGVRSPHMRPTCFPTRPGVHATSSRWDTCPTTSDGVKPAPRPQRARRRVPFFNSVMYGHQPGGRMGHSPRRVDMETGQCDEFNLLHKLAGQG